MLNKNEKEGEHHLIAFFAEHRIVFSRTMVLLLGLAMYLLPSVVWAPAGHGMLYCELLGSFLLIVAGLGRMWCALYIADRKSRTLITQGPYSMSRNPLYVFSFFGGLGFFIALAQFAVMGLYVLCFFGYYRMVILHEESHLRGIHGAAWDAYVKAAPRFWPRPRLFRTEPTMTMAWRCFGKSCLDSMWFLWALLLVRVLNSL